MATLFPLPDILPNPWQPRQAENAEHIQQLAESIAASGMLQTPTGRLVADGKVQLAFGHSRLSAYRLLAASDITGKWSLMPVNIEDLTDEQMATIAITENIDRRDLNPLEIARAMQRYRDEFKKSSEEIGKMFGLSASAVRNKLRLLELPEKVLESFSAGDLKEGAARELLALFELPAQFITDQENTYPEQLRPRVIIAQACKGARAADVHQWIDEMIDRGAQPLINAPWDTRKTFLEDLPGAFGPCVKCPSYMVRNGKELCINKRCYQDYTNAWRTDYAARAAQAVGFPVYDGFHNLGSSSEVVEFYQNEVTALETAKSHHCPNLRVMYTQYDHRSKAPGSLVQDGFKNAELICQKRRQNCTCLRAADNKVEIKADATKPVTTETLKQVNREISQAKRKRVQQTLDLHKITAARLAEAIADQNPKAWLEIVQALGTWHSSDLANSLTVTDLRYDIGDNLASRIYSVADGTAMDPDDAEKAYNRVLQKLGLPPVSIETPLVEAWKPEEPPSIEAAPDSDIDDAEEFLEGLAKKWGPPVEVRNA